jgi:hypothetical protein
MSGNDEHGPEANTVESATDAGRTDTASTEPADSGHSDADGASDSDQHADGGPPHPGEVEDAVLTTDPEAQQDDSVIQPDTA